MNESTLVPREEMSDLDWLARNVHVWPVNAKFAVRPGMGEVLFYEHHYSHLVQFSREQVEARRAELQNKPSWGSVGSDINFISQHDDGQWIGHSEKPSEADECFECNCVVSLFGYGEVLGDWRDTLEKRPEQTIADICREVTGENRHEEIFEPFVSVEDAQQELSELEMLAKVSHLISDKRHRITPSKYTKTIRGVSVDVYDVLQAWGVSNPALQHLIKKALQCGQRGHKDNAQDLQDIIDSAIRAKELG